MSEPLSPAEAAALAVLLRLGNEARLDVITDEVAREVAAAVRPHAENEGAVKALGAAMKEIQTLASGFNESRDAVRFSGAISGLERAKSILSRRITKLTKPHLPWLEGEQDHA